MMPRPFRADAPRLHASDADAVFGHRLDSDMIEVLGGLGFDDADRDPVPDRRTNRQG
jgi:hypothetical protein